MSYRAGQKLLLQKEYLERQERQERERQMKQRGDQLSVPLSVHQQQQQRLGGAMDIGEVPTIQVTSQLKHPTPFHLEAKRKQQLQEHFVPARDETGSLGHSPHLGSSPSNFPYNQGVSPNFQSKLLQEDSGTLLSAAGGMNDGAYIGAATGGQDQFSDYFNSPPPSLEHQLPQDSPIPPFLGHSDGRGLEEFLEGVNSDYGAWNLSSTLPLPGGNMFDSVMNQQGLFPPSASHPISASCPADMPPIKQEFDPNDPSSMFFNFGQMGGSQGQGEMGGAGGGESVDSAKFGEKERHRKDVHNEIERRRRYHINDRIKELGTMLPVSEQDSKQNKGTILKATVDYIRKMQRDMDRYRAHEVRTKQMEDSMRLLKLRIQELEVMARAHGMPTPALMPETKPLAHAAEQALGSVTPRSSTPSATTPVSLLTPQRSARETPVDLTELVRNSPSIDLRASPGLDLAKLNLDDSRGLTHSPHTPRLEQIMEDESTQQSSHPMDS